MHNTQCNTTKQKKIAKTHENDISRIHKTEQTPNTRALRYGQSDRFLGELSPSRSAFYKLARALKMIPAPALPPLVRPDLPPAFEDIDKAECMADSNEFHNRSARVTE
ncbi:jg3172 [Pararge aegeria aegeria]|uniref:Jg3172 protein n=1 Tax=Pararge aegeria aegeria TaxID=348720 RepID=A0A8S4QH39_9NEOP|nr:jg3172 [Pararge aegeria aegeria]